MIDFHVATKTHIILAHPNLSEGLFIHITKSVSFDAFLKSIYSIITVIMGKRIAWRNTPIPNACAAIPAWPTKPRHPILTPSRWP